MKTPFCLLVFCLLSACSHQARKVDCDAHLTPINPPTLMIKTNATPTVPPTTSEPKAP